jgi:hypothetical protein
MKTPITAQIGVGGENTNNGTPKKNPAIKRDFNMRKSVCTIGR